jgi:hypothetical protein
MAALARNGAFARAQGDERLNRFLGHQQADAAEHQDVEDADDGIDLPQSLKQAEDEDAQPGAHHAARDQHAAHAEIDRAARHMGDDARHRSARHLRRGGGGGDGGRDAVEDEERGGEETAAHAEHARQQAYDAAQGDDDQRVHRQIGDGQIEIHGFRGVMPKRGDIKASRARAIKNPTRG